MEKPDVDAIEGLSPAISIEQKTAGHNPRSTVGTVTEIYDYLRLLYARAGTPHCPNCGRPVAAAERRRRSPIACSRWPEGTKIEILAPLVRGRKGEFRELFESARKQGFVRAVRRRRRSSRSPIRRSSTGGRTTTSRSSSTASSCAPTIAAASPTRSRPRSSWPTGSSRSSNADDERRRRSCSPSSTAVPTAASRMPELEPRHFSFNSPFGACPTCGGLGTRARGERGAHPRRPEHLDPRGRRSCRGASRRAICARSILPALAQAVQVRPQRAVGRALPPTVRDVLLHGTAARRRRGKKTTFKGDASTWEGIIANVERRYDETRLRHRCAWSSRSTCSRVPCRTCGGRRLKPESLAVTIDGTQHRRARRAVDRRGARVLRQRAGARDDGEPGLDPEIAGPILKEVRERLRFLVDVGLDYLTLGRSAESLSGGEAQRIRLATQIGSRLVGVLYILDEPSIGLHQRDNARLLATLEQLRDLGNTVIVVEHDEETMRAADHVIDLGPGAGKHGGDVIAEGTVDEIARNPRRSPGEYLQRRAARSPSRASGARRSASSAIRDRRARASTTCATSTSRSRSGCSSRSPACRARASPRSIEDILHRALARHFYRARVDPGRARAHHGARAHRQGHRHRPEPDRPHAALQPGDVHRAVHADPRAVRRAARGEDPRLRARAASRST